MAKDKSSTLNNPIRMLLPEATTYITHNTHQLVHVSILRNLLFLFRQIGVELRRIDQMLENIANRHTNQTERLQRRVDRFNVAHLGHVRTWPASR